MLTREDISKGINHFVSCWSAKRDLKEESHKQSFWIDFLKIFDITEGLFYTFEFFGKSQKGTKFFIDLYCPEMFVIEHKSPGKNLQDALLQANEYYVNLNASKRPRFVIVSDFFNFIIQDKENNQEYRFHLTEMLSKIDLLIDIFNNRRIIIEQNQLAVDIEATKLVAKLYNKLQSYTYNENQLQLFVIRLIFCFFAEDSGIFPKNHFQKYILNHKNSVGVALAEIFQVLNQKETIRQKNINEELNQFPYVNGDLFKESINIAVFDEEMTDILLACSALNWNYISPAIFGSMVQYITDEIDRRNFGEHYTSEINTLKLLNPLFLDALWKEFDNANSNKKKLQTLQNKISMLRFLDPACGCGNFLVVAYRELRKLEIAILKILLSGQKVFELGMSIKCNINQFYGIEIKEFPVNVARLAMWLIDHQMNMLASRELGDYFIRLPLNKPASIIHGNALEIDWDRLLDADRTVDIRAKHTDIFVVSEPEVQYGRLRVQTDTYKIHNKQLIEDDTDLRFDYILGNPPFIGKQLQNDAQKKDMENVFRGVKGAGVLDYVLAWYIKALGI